MYVNDLLIRCQELVDRGAGDRTVVDSLGKVIDLVDIGPDHHVAIISSKPERDEAVPSEESDSEETLESSDEE